MYELLVLALLMHWPLYAYLIAEIANHILGPWERISRGTLSSLLTRLEQEGLIAPAAPEQVPFPTEHPSRVFAITETGRERFHQLMMDTTSNQGTYQRLFHIKALHLEFVSPEERLSLVDHYISYCQMGLRYQQAQAQDYVTNPVKSRSVSSFYGTTALSLMDLISQQWQLELAWVQRLRERVVAQASQEIDIQSSERNKHVH
ncbi:MAG TPA: helix-turn-helix transcriptional regulator [Ktedonobacteraceae bacterium]|jgi:DNA-binding PadR family transcriptional regulator|nr:helix-turn-helix transcriptional regulator [Ktedonobacteraceae bacterium]